MQISDQLEKDGVVVLPGFLQGEMLTRMQLAFDSRLQRLRWNDFDGYEKTERFRHMVQDVLTLDQGFVDAAIHPLVKETLGAYLGDTYELVEAKGWKSLPTRRMFHGWHGDAWYDQTKVSGIPREVKLAFYLTDVKTGAFNYIKGTHRTHQPRSWRNHEIQAFSASQIVEVAGAAGTGFLFDTSGVHGQSCPILEPRHAVFYNYHDPSVPLQKEDLDYYRYHPLLLNAAFLGGLTPEDQRILGFGNKTNYISGFERKPKHKTFQTVYQRAFHTKVLADEFSSRISARLNLLLRAK
jgi:hypothetical protein